jgi:hypothetical protein
MYTLEINGTALVVTNAAEDDARALLQSEDFKSDLQSLTREGRPLWDGRSPMTIRAATAEEAESFEEAMDDDEYEDEAEEEHDDDDDEEPIDIVFLVEVDDDEDEGGASA